MTPERRALFLAAQHCQGGHSEAGAALAEVLGVPFPLRMDDLVAKVRAEGHNPALMYPWLIKAVRLQGGEAKGAHPYFSEPEIAAAVSRPGRLCECLAGECVTACEPLPPGVRCREPV